MPGPDCALNGMRQPIFLYCEEFEQWMARTVGVDAPNLTEAHVRPDPGETKRVLATRAFSVEEVMERTGLSKTKLYEEIEHGNLCAQKMRCAHVDLGVRSGQIPQWPSRGLI